MSDTCGAPVTHGFVGSTRTSSRCGRPLHEDSDLCLDHLREKEYQQEQFRQMMDRATRHSGGTGYANRGVYCGCGTFVKEGEEHPWGVPMKEEAEWWRKNPLAPHRPEYIPAPSKAAIARQQMLLELQAVIEKCTCDWPLVKYRNGDGHDDHCPAHKPLGSGRKT